jgi:hypothetical protein
VARERPAQQEAPVMVTFDEADLVHPRGIRAGAPFRANSLAG